MKQVENNVVEVILKEKEQKDILVFVLDETKPEDYYISLSDAEAQVQIKNLFLKLLEMLLESNITLKFVVEDGYSKQLYIEVCEEYISDLTRELEQVRDTIIEDVN